MRRYSLKQLVAFTRTLSANLRGPIHVYSEPHQVSEAVLRWLRLKTSNGIVHAGYKDSRSADHNDARTLCQRSLHYCDLQSYRCPNRHKGRAFSKATSAEIDCMACITAKIRLEEAYDKED